MLVGPSKCLKQIIKILANITGLLIPTGWRQTSGLFTSLVEDWTRDYREQIQLAVRAGLELGVREGKKGFWARGKPPSSRAPRVSLAPKTPFPFPFKRLPRRVNSGSLNCKSSALTARPRCPLWWHLHYRSKEFVTLCSESWQFFGRLCVHPFPLLPANNIATE